MSDVFTAEVDPGQKTCQESSVVAMKDEAAEYVVGDPESHHSFRKDEVDQLEQKSVLITEVEVSHPTDKEIDQEIRKVDVTAKKSNQEIDQDVNEKRDFKEAKLDETLDNAVEKSDLGEADQDSVVDTRADVDEKQNLKESTNLKTLDYYSLLCLLLRSHYVPQKILHLHWLSHLSSQREVLRG